MSQSHIRNFAIVAHIDHGKSTLADRLLETTGTVEKRDMEAQLLDSNPIERERGITIKLAPVRMEYIKISNDQFLISNEFQKLEISNSKLDISGSKYILNLIDTPGHVDFSYEVSRSLAACEGILLVVDATQGIQAQTLAHMQQVRARNLPVIPIINKVDLPQADIPACKKALHDVFKFQDAEFIEISAKTGLNIDAVLDAIITRIPSPQGNIDKPLRALVFSSTYDPHRGIIVFVRIVDGSLRLNPDPNFKLKFLATATPFHPIEVGYFIPQMKRVEELSTGEVGYIATGLKDARVARIGDTITIFNDQFSIFNKIEPLPGYKEPKPMVFLGIFPVEGDDFVPLREALEKLNLSDSAFTFEATSSSALGNGFHCGFLGLLHAEIVLERLDREFDINALSTIPSVSYQVTLTDGTQLTIQRAERLPDPSTIKEIQEPMMMVTIFAPRAYVGAIMQLCEEKRGSLHDLMYLENQTKFTYTMPLAEMLVDFFDRLKGATEGYASLDYEFFTYQPVDAVKLSILVHHEDVDALASIVVRDKAESIGRAIAKKLVEVIPRKQFEIPIQAAIGGKIVARESVKSFRKDVTQKLYGGDRSRKDKLLNKQKKGKKKMKMIGSVEIPQTAFLAVLSR